MHAANTPPDSLQRAAGGRFLCPGHPRLDRLAQVLVLHLLWIQHAVEGKWCFFALVFVF